MLKQKPKKMLKQNLKNVEAKAVKEIKHNMNKS